MLIISQLEFHKMIALVLEILLILRRKFLDLLTIRHHLIYNLALGTVSFGAGVRRTGNMLTLDYNDTNWLEQPFATRVENVTPFLVNFYNGSIDLEPSVDVWIDTNQLEVRDVLQEGAFSSIASLIDAEVETAEDGSRIGVAPVVWDSWETVGAQLDISITKNRITKRSSSVEIKEMVMLYLRHKVLVIIESILLELLLRALFLMDLFH